MKKKNREEDGQEYGTIILNMFDPSTFAFCGNRDGCEEQLNVGAKHKTTAEDLGESKQETDGGKKGLDFV